MTRSVVFVYHFITWLITHPQLTTGKHNNILQDFTITMVVYQVWSLDAEHNTCPRGCHARFQINPSCAVSIHPTSRVFLQNYWGLFTIDRHHKTPTQQSRSISHHPIHRWQTSTRVRGATLQLDREHRLMLITTFAHTVDVTTVTS